MGPLLWIAVSLCGLCLLLLLLYLLLLIRPRARQPKNSALLCKYAHRGLHGRGIPENSRAAFDLACQKGFGIELDVQLSRDGEVMVFHDYTLDRVVGREGKLCDLCAAELGTLSLCGTEQTIPTFREVLALVNGRVPILVELKGESMDTSLCAKVAALLREYEGLYCIESFNPLLLREMRKHLPDAYYGLLYTNVCRDKKKKSLLNMALTAMALNILAKPNFIAYNQLDRDSLPVKLTTRLYRAPRFVWTARREEERSRADALGECAIFELD